MAECCVLQNGAGLGSGTFGSMPFGTSVSSSAIGLCSATPETMNEVVVKIDGDIGIPNPCDPNDPTNKSTWELVPLNPGVCVRLVQRVDFEEPDCIRLFFDGPLCCGEPYLITSSIAQLGCDTAAFTGLCVDPQAQESDVRDDDGFIRDIANPQLPNDALMSGRYLALGTFEFTDTGDLAQDFGVRSLRKRILRRIMTTTNQFFHLRGYGTNLEIKALVRPDRLRRLQEKLRAQILREPEVADVRVVIQAVTGVPDVVRVAVRAQTIGGKAVDLAAPISIQ
jgi:hypothetical protein